MEPTKKTPSERPLTLSFEEYLTEQATVAVSGILSADSLDFAPMVSHLMVDDAFVRQCAREYHASHGGEGA